MNIVTKGNMSQHCGLEAGTETNFSTRPRTFYTVECFGADGQLKWTEKFENAVVTTGLNRLLDATFKTGFVSPTWFVGLKGVGSVSLADTMAAHGGWPELGAATSAYSNATRPALTLGTIATGSVDNSGARAVFNINATVTVYGCFLTTVSTVDGTTGILYGAGDFSSSRAVLSGDVLNVTLTITVS
jgi:hypothetical protein